MKKTVAAITLLVVLGLAGCSKTTSAVKAYFSNGEREIRSALDAKASAKSFKMTTRIAVHDDSVMETNFYVSCPDRERITMKISKLYREMIRIGQRFYINEDGTWYFKDVDAKDWSPCGANPGLPSPWALLTEGRDHLAGVGAEEHDGRENRRQVVLGIVLEIGHHLHAQGFIFIQITRHARYPSLDLWQRHDQAHGHHGAARGVLDVGLLQRRSQFVEINETSNFFFG